MPFLPRIALDTLRSIAFGSISGTYAAVGTALTHPMRLMVITNNTDGDMFISDDGVNNKLFVAASSYKTYDISTNRDGGKNESSKLPKGITMYVKQSTAPTKGAVYIEFFYSSGE